MDASIYLGLALINGFLAVMFDEENQDKHMSLEAVEFMVTAVRESEEFDLNYVVSHYCTIIDKAEDVDEITYKIRQYAQNYPAAT